MAFRGIRPPSKKEVGLEMFIDSQKAHHPLGWGYDEWLWLYQQGLTLANLAKAMNKKSTTPIKEWIAQFKDEKRNID